MSGADLANLVNQAAIKGASEGKQVVDAKAFEYAKDKIMMGAERKSWTISDAEKRNTAFHEAGHALVAMKTNGALPIHKATIMPRGNTLGVVHLLPTNDQVSETKKMMLASMDVAMGGRCAEELTFGAMEATGGCSSDFMNATRVARRMVTRYGMSDALGKVSLVNSEGNTSGISSGTLENVEKEIKKLCDVSQLLPACICFVLNRSRKRIKGLRSSSPRIKSNYTLLPMR